MVIPIIKNKWEEYKMGYYGWYGDYVWTSEDHESVYAGDHDSVKQEIVTKSEKIDDLKRKAEESYAAAITWKREGNVGRARAFAIEAISLYEQLNIQTLEEAAPTRMRVNGVELPDIMHQDVVKERLGVNWSTKHP